MTDVERRIQKVEEAEEKIITIINMLEVDPTVRVEFVEFFRRPEIQVEIHLE